MSPRLQVVYLAFIRRIVAFDPRANRIFGSSHEPLLFTGHAFRAVEIDRALEGVNEGDKPALCQRARNEFRAGEAGTVGELDGDFLAVAIDDAVEFVERDNCIRRNGRTGGWGGAGRGEELRNGIERRVLVQAGFQVRDERRGPGNREGPRRVLAAADAHTGARRGWGIELAQLLARQLFHLIGIGGSAAQLHAQAPGIALGLSAGCVALDNLQRG